MKIDIFYKNISSNTPLERFIEDKIGGLDKVLGNNKSSARVEIGLPSKHHRSGRIYYAEVNLKMGGALLRATCQHDDMRKAIVDVKNELYVQINKFKEKRKDLSRKASRVK